MSVDKSGQRVRQMFGEISHRYDLMNHLLSCGTDIYWRWRTVRVAAPTGSAPILDVCSGTGDLAFAYHKRTSGRVPILGTDFTHNMLIRANAKRDRKASRMPQFLEADTQHLPFADNTFQIVCVAFGLRNVSDTAAGLREMARVCQTGGQVVVLEFSTPRVPLLGPIYQWYFQRVLPRIGQLLARNRQSAYDYLPASVSEFPSGPELADTMQQCGLERVTWTPLTLGVATLYIGHKRGHGGTETGQETGQKETGQQALSGANVDSAREGRARLGRVST